MVSLDLSRISGSDQLIALVVTCASSWMESALQDPRSPQRYIVYDEAWRTLKEPSLLARMQAQWKLARALGISNLMIIHALTDLDAVGDANSQTRNLALGLLRDCSTKVIYAQQPDQIPTPWTPSASPPPKAKNSSPSPVAKPYGGSAPTAPSSSPTASPATNTTSSTPTPGCWPEVIRSPEFHNTEDLPESVHLAWPHRPQPKGAAASWNHSHVLRWTGSG